MVGAFEQLGPVRRKGGGGGDEAIFFQKFKRPGGYPWGGGGVEASISLVHKILNGTAQRGRV